MRKIDLLVSSKKLLLFLTLSLLKKGFLKLNDEI